MASKEFFKLADSLNAYIDTESPQADALIESASKIGKSFSGSWFGYHSRIYYANFQVPPPGAVFSQEWGLMDVFSMGTRGSWHECSFDYVVSVIYEDAGNPSLEDSMVLANKAAEAFDEVKTSALSLLYSKYDIENDKFLAKNLEKIEEAKIFDRSDFIDYMRPKGQATSRDIAAIEKGHIVPPHFSVLAEASAVKSPFFACKELKKLIVTVASHIANLENKDIREERIGTNIFIGHGRSSHWRELKDFVNDRLGLPWDEFNRVPVAGVTNVTRLAQMLDQASFAFLVMTAEDEQADGNLHARMNVIHEVGLFQGRLGFERAIVLLEEGCQEFSNIQGLGQIRFPAGNISAVFEDVRAVLERELIIE